jgi:hypothetical protein
MKTILAKLEENGASDISEGDIEFSEEDSDE